ncbi:unnamed protein product, partial [Prorocentrum cordatum]
RPLQAAVKFQPKGMRGVSPRAPARSKRRCCCPGQPPRKRQPDGGWQASGSVAVASPSPASRLGQRSTHPRGLCLSTPAVCAACPEASGSESWTCSAAAEAAAAAAVAHRYVEIHSGVGAVSGEVPPRCRNVLAASRGQRPGEFAVGLLLRAFHRHGPGRSLDYSRVFFLDDAFRALVHLMEKRGHEKIGEGRAEQS